MIPPARVSSDRVPSIHAQARSSGISLPGNRGIKVVQGCTVARSAADLYAFWRKAENLPRVIEYPVEILPLAQDSQWWVSVWVDGHRFEWNTVIINDEPGQLIAWQSLEGAPVPHAGTIRFQPAADGSTEVVVQLEYDPPGGKLAALFARLSGGGDVRHQVADALRRCKALMETEGLPRD